MKSLVPWMCLLVASPVMADDYNAYRLGHYEEALQPLLNQNGKSAVAEYYLGRIYLHGYGQLKNTPLAMRYFKQSAKKGYLPAILVMAKYALFQEKNIPEALSWFKQAANLGDVDAQMFMAASYTYGLGGKKNQDLATRYYIDAAKNGNAIAQYALSKKFRDSRHAANKKLGLIWLNKAANNNNPKALTELGMMYVEGKGLEKDSVKGIELLHKAAQQGDALAMVKLGELALSNSQQEVALQWFEKASQSSNNKVYLELAKVYLQDKSSLYNPATAFSWTLKAAQNDSVAAKRQLADMYKKGLGVEASEDLAKQWLAKAKDSEKKKEDSKILSLAALWLSNGSTDKLANTSYQMNGIFSHWTNPDVLVDQAYNQAPQLETLPRQDIFKPQFSLVQPNSIHINNYYDALVPNEDLHWHYPAYSLNQQVANALMANNSVLAHLAQPVPYKDARYEITKTEASVMDWWTDGWEKQANYMSVFYDLYKRAILGDAQAQFEIGQMFEYGIAVPQNFDAAIIFYQNAVQQQHLAAEYNLGILRIKQAKEASDYQMAINDLTDAAFKGNKKSQYVLSRLLAKGLTSPEGVEYIKADPEQAEAMLYLAAANSYGLAEYELANRFAKQPNFSLSMAAKKEKVALMRELYEDAVKRGISKALIPLAFYNAMEADSQKQSQAFITATEQAMAGDEQAALLLGLLYDRGIGVAADRNQAIYWYQKAGQNAVTDFILGTYEALGTGVDKNLDKGLALLEKASQAHFSYADFNKAMLEKQEGQNFLPALVQAYKNGNSHAGVVLADYYLAQHQDPQTMEQARDIYSHLAQKGDKDAQLKMAYMDEAGLGAPANLSEAERWYLASAEQGNAVSQYLLGQFYQLGLQGEPNYTMAKQWYDKAALSLPQANVALGFLEETVNDNYAQALKEYEKAAARGNTIALYNLALMYMYGKGTPVNFAKATELFTKAAAQNMPEAMNQLGKINFKGLGQERNEAQALSWFEKAARLGNANALYELGLLSETGVSTSRDFAKALQYYQASANKGNEKAMLALARMYQFGFGVAKNPKIAAEYYQKLAVRQNAYAQYQLGSYYLDGSIGERSVEKGKSLLHEASENGSAEARKMLEQLEAQSQARVSYIDPLSLSGAASSLQEKNASLLYLQALNQWNSGDESLSRRMLHQLVNQHPDFGPAKEIKEIL